MRSGLTRFRAFFALLSAVVLAVVFIAWEGEPNRAQERSKRPPAQLPEKFANPDAVTAAIRSRSSELTRVEGDADSVRQRLGASVEIVESYGDFTVVAAEPGMVRGAGMRSQELETTIHLPNGRFDPRVDFVPSIVAPNTETEPAEGYYVVQFGGIATDEWLESLKSMGVEIVQYVPHQAFIVYGNGDAIAKTAAHSRVRWVGSYLPENKSDDVVHGFAQRAETERAVFDVAVFSRADLNAVAWEFRNKVNGSVIARSELSANFFNVLRVEMPVAELDTLASIKDVFRIDPYIKPAIEDERAAQIVAGNYSSVTVLNAPGYDPLTQFGVDGSGVTVGMVDDGVSIPGNGGFYVTANNTVDGPLRGATAGASGGHGHINASIIAGSTPFGILDPTGYNYGRGIAPGANIVNIPFLKANNTTTDAQAVDDTLNTLGPNGVRGTITNNSWGSGTNGNSYDSLAAQYDSLVRDASIASTIDPFTIVFSAGNSGTSGLTRPKMSKNTIAVANSENVRTELSGSANNIDDLSNTSSRGPAADGRIKPDITAPGTVITGSRAGDCTSVSSCFDANHAYSSGTSHAAPQVAGAAALFTQYWRAQNSGVYPSPAMIKSAIILTGQEMNGNITNASTLPNGNEGWGRMNMRLMMNTGVPMKYVDQSHAFSDPGTNVVYSGTVADATKPFRVSLVWTDPPGTTNPALVNNLDLTVTVGSSTYLGNVFSGGNSATGGANSTIDNVEQVRLPAGIAAGTPVTITVSSVALNGDGILGNADTTDQHFALVAYNYAEPTVGASAPFDFDGDGKTDVSIFRPTPGEWWYLKSSDGGNAAATFGASTDTIVPADYTGDGKTDMAFFRPGTGQWFILRSNDFTFYAFPFGSGTDVTVPGDYDGDNKADAAVFRPSNSTWYIFRSSDNGTTITTFGTAGDKPVPADYDGDGKTDTAIYRPSLGQWWLNRSTDGVIAATFGAATDQTVQGDYTGDGKADMAYFRPSTNEWFILRSSDFSFYSFVYGAAGDVASPGDYDGDGKTDATVFRPSSNTWYSFRSSTSGTVITPFGAAGDRSVPNAYVR